MGVVRKFLVKNGPLGIRTNHKGNLPYGSFGRTEIWNNYHIGFSEGLGFRFPWLCQESDDSGGFPFFWQMKLPPCSCTSHCSRSINCPLPGGAVQLRSVLPPGLNQAFGTQGQHIPTEIHELVGHIETC